MNDFASLVAKLNAISVDEQPLESVSGTDLYTPVKENVEGTANTKKLLNIFNEIQEEKTVTEAKDDIEEEYTEENVVDSMKARFSDFMKAEVAQGNDISVVSDAVTEGTAAADAIDRAFNAMFKNLNQLMSITIDGGKLRSMVEEEGGDASLIGEARQSLNEAYEKLEEAHMYSQPADYGDE
jgi:hypothetical protein